MDAVVLAVLAVVGKLRFVFADKDDFTKVRAVNLGGWLVVEGWIKPSLFDGIPNGDMLVGPLSCLLYSAVHFALPSRDVGMWLRFRMACRCSSSLLPSRST